MAVQRNRDRQEADRRGNSANEMTGTAYWIPMFFALVLLELKFRRDSGLGGRFLTFKLRKAAFQIGDERRRFAPIIGAQRVLKRP
jgi:hypothetical protein